MDLTDFKNYLSINLGKKSALNYEEQMKSFFKQHEELTQDTLNQYLSSKVDKWGAGSFNAFFKAMKWYFKYTKTTLDLPAFKRVERKVRPYLKEKDIQDILDKCPLIFDDYKKVQCILEILFMSGMRPKELLNLQRKNINIEERKIVLVETKTFKSRTVFLTPSLAKKIQYIFERETEKENAFNLNETSISYYCQKISECLNIKFNAYMTRHCVSADTEILTEEGWKKWDELNNLKIFTLNQSTKKLELSKIQNLHSYNYNGYLYSITNKYLDLIATPEHKMFISIFTQKTKNGNNQYIALPYKLYTLNEIINYPNLYYAKTLLCAKTNQNRSINRSLAFILGVILTDGNIHKRKYTISMSISQSLSANPKKCKLIEYHLQNSGLQYTKRIQPIKINGYNQKPYQMIVYRIRTISQPTIFKYLNYDNSPKIKLILFSYNTLKSIFQGLMLGDGCRDKEFCDQNLKTIKFIQIIGTLINKQINYQFNQKHRTYINNSHLTYNIKKQDIKLIHYTGIVWCPETKNGTWVAKRNNKIFISGNSFAHLYLKKSGNDLISLSKTLGHSGLQTTQIYSEIDDKERQERFDKIFKEKR